ncbi:ead/Ea22-like family protein [Yersinia intermedia]|uniref:ead/Ea22-like family protein n=1 Tax=Yersinia intermedia TaxID=631 RepID=UPI0005AD54A1|nr:ead/Ea22-like family protein [Yersinia intermedia]AJJ17747.1 ead/Ea22-like family protein [Yersinia intermedia]
MNNIEELKKAALEATQGEWWQDVVETEGTYGVGDDCSEGFHSYAVYGPDNRSLLDMTNSTAAIIHTEDDGDYLMAWDETGRRNAKYIALANPAAILDLIAQLEAVQKESAIRMEAIEQMRKTVAHNVDRTQKAEAALSAANEKLKGDQVPVAANNGVTAENLRVIKMLLDVCGTAFELADDSCQQDVDGELCHVVPDSAFSRLSDALGEIENTLPDEYEDLPNIVLQWAAIPRHALQELFTAAPQPAGFTVEGGELDEHL